MEQSRSPEMIWSERYLGNGAWAVTLAAGKSVISALEGLDYKQLAESNPVGVSMVAAISEGGEWQVYEFSGKVNSMRTSYVDIFCR
jgi:hypothetical protein